MAQRLPKAAILGSRIGPLQTRSLFDEPARSLPPEKCPDLPAQGSTGTRAAMFVSPPSAIELAGFYVYSHCGLPSSVFLLLNL